VVLFSPNNLLKLLLSNVRGNFAVHLTGAQGHCQRLCHVFLYTWGNVRVPTSRANPHISRTLVLKLALTQLRKLCARYE
jgi:hypothetical protein